MHPVLIVYSTQTGRTRQLVEACAQGLRADGEVEVTVRVAHDAGDGDAALAGRGPVVPQHHGQCKRRPTPS